MDVSGKDTGDFLPVAGCNGPQDVSASMSGRKRCVAKRKKIVSPVFSLGREVRGMDQGTVINIAQNALLVTLYVSAPLLGISLLVGLAVSIFQATTQIQEQTLSFIPKILAVIVAIAVFGSWMLKLLMEYTQGLFQNINQYIR